MAQDIIISIRHAFAEKIYSGEKRFELRKRRPNVQPGTRCWIYEPKPVGKVTGFFTYMGCFRDTKEKVYEHCKDYIGIDRETFMQYYNRESIAHAWQVATHHRCKPFTLKDAGIERAPQSYIITGSAGYLDGVVQHMVERHDINSQFRKLIMDIVGSQGREPYRIGSDWLKMGDLMDEWGDVVKFSDRDNGPQSKRLDLQVEIPNFQMHTMSQDFDLLEFVKGNATMIMRSFVRKQGAKSVVVLDKGFFSVTWDEDRIDHFMLHIIVDVFIFFE